MSKKVRDNPNNRRNKPDLNKERAKNGNMREEFYTVPGLCGVEISDKEHVKQFDSLLPIKTDKWGTRKVEVRDYDNDKELISVDKLMRKTFYIKRGGYNKSTENL